MHIRDLQIEIVNQKLNDFFESTEIINPGSLYMTLQEGKLKVCTEAKAPNQSSAKIPDRLITHYLSTLSIPDQQKAKSIENKVSILRKNVSYYKKMRSYFQNLKGRTGIECLKDRMMSWKIHEISLYSSKVLLENPLILNILPQVIRHITASFNLNENELNLLEKVSYQVDEKLATSISITINHVKEFQNFSGIQISNKDEILDLSLLDLPTDSILKFIRLLSEEPSKQNGATDVYYNLYESNKFLEHYAKIYESISSLVNKLNAAFPLEGDNRLSVNLLIKAIKSSTPQISIQNAIDALESIFFDKSSESIDEKTLVFIDNLFDLGYLKSKGIEKQWLQYILKLNENSPVLNRCMVSFYNRANKDTKLYQKIVLEIAKQDKRSIQKLITLSLSPSLEYFEESSHDFVKQIYNFWNSIKDKVSNKELPRLLSKLKQYIEFRKDFNIGDFDQLASLLTDSALPNHGEEDLPFISNKDSSTLLYQEYLISKGSQEEKAMDKLLTDLITDLEFSEDSRLLYTKIADNYTFLTSYFNFDPVYWSEQHYSKACDLEPKDSFLFRIAPIRCKHAIYAKLEKKENGKFKLFIGNTGAGILNNQDFHPYNESTGYYQTTAFLDDVEITKENMDKLGLIILEGYKKHQQLEGNQERVEYLPLIDDFYECIRNQFGSPQHLNIEDNPVFWARPQYGGSCTTSCFWTLIKTDMPEKAIRKLKNRMRVKFLCELFWQYRVNKKIYHNNVRPMLDLIVKLKQVLKTKYSENIEPIDNYIALLDQISDTIYLQETDNLNREKSKIESETLEDLRLKFMNNKTVQDLLDIYLNIASRDMRELEKILAKIDIEDVKNDIKKLSPEAIDPLFNVYFEFSKNIGARPSRSENLQDILVSTIANYIYHRFAKKGTVSSIDDAKHGIGIKPGQWNIVKKHYWNYTKEQAKHLLKPESYLSEYKNTLKLLSKLNPYFKY